MNNWYSVSLGDGIMAVTPLAKTEERFLQLFTATGSPLDMAVFTHSESEVRLHCEVIAYYSPSAAQAAEEFDVQQCEKPARAGLGLLAGDAGSGSALFPIKLKAIKGES